MTTKYFTVHNLGAMQKGEFSAIVGNCPNTLENRQKASLFFDPMIFYIEFHNYKYDMSVMAY